MQTSDWKMKRMTATGQALGAGQVFGGIIVQAAGTTTVLTAYDDTSAVAASLIIPATATANSNVAGVYVSPMGGAVGTLTATPNVAGLILVNGLWLVIGGTGTPSVWVLYR